MKYVVCVPDGCADQPVAALGGRTPLEAAELPTLQGLAARAEIGRAGVIPPGLPPGSDVGNMSIFGYDPAEYHTGRAPIEAAALGIDLADDQVAFRCNLVTVGDDGTMVDFAGGHPDSDAAANVIAELDAALGGDTPDGPVSFHPGVQYRHIVVAPASWADAECVPPHDLSDKAIIGPSGPAAGRLADLMERSRPIVGGSSLAANQIWLWGQGTRPQLPSFTSRWGLDAGLVTAVDLVRGLGVLAGVEVIDVEGATGWYDTNYEGKREAALDALADGADLFIIHVEATDEAGHAGNVEEKVKALENWDRRILAPLIGELDELGPWRMLLLPDHGTPVELKTHTPDPVPYLLFDSQTPVEGGRYTEAGVADRPLVPGHELMGRLVAVR
ncbi:MAG TPA: cofactor-independent phosphoglycerate mutase [Acidimicrobiales bacterium]|jgi:2,3-bisphosphoglycerate-independent phosphoglycerate mutase|nr:cofactor-independent phosphoglycerate mutase [Acidimicrobiales bacterium]